MERTSSTPCTSGQLFAEFGGIDCSYRICIDDDTFERHPTSVLKLCKVRGKKEMVLQDRISGPSNEAVGVAARAILRE